MALTVSHNKYRRKRKKQYSTLELPILGTQSSAMCHAMGMQHSMCYLQKVDHK